MVVYRIQLLCAVAVLVVGVALAAGDADVTEKPSPDIVDFHDHDEHHHHHHDEDTPDAENEPDTLAEIPEEELEYRKGSLCGYCTYCKFCKLCDRDCPCESGPGKPNCHMCKYCKFCYMCKMCDTVCQAGGIIDRVTSKLFNAMPRYNKEDIEKDISGVKGWIEKNKDEL